MLERAHDLTGALGVAGAVADLAQLVKAGGWVENDDERDPSLLQRRVDSLVEQDAPGASELAAMLKEVSTAR